MKTIEEVHYTPRELEIIKLFLMGFSRKETGDILEISFETVNTHFKHLMLKTDQHSIEDFIFFLLSHGFSVSADRTEIRYNGIIL